MSIIQEILSLIPGYNSQKSVDQNVADFSDKVKGLLVGAAQAAPDMSSQSVENVYAVEPATVSQESIFLNSLKELQCKPERVGDENNTNPFYKFEFQSKTFRAHCINNDNIVNMCFPCFYAANIDDLNAVRHLCNQFNDSLLVPKITYSIDKEKGNVYVHAELVMSDCSTANLKKWLDAFFQIQQSFSLRIEKELEENRGGFFHDFEYQSAISARELTLSRELEIAHQQQQVDVHRGNNEFNFTIADFMGIAYHRNSVACYKKLRIINGDKVTVIDGNETIAQWALHSALIDCHGQGVANPENSKTARFITQDAVVIVNFVDAGEKRHSITINLKAKGENDDSLYYRAYAMLEPHDIDREHSIEASGKNTVAADATSLLLVFDKRDINKKLQEFDYMWKDAIIKERDNDPSITDEELLLAQITSPAVGLSYYWGKRCFAAGYYAQALKHFLNAFSDVKSSPNVTDAMESLCYYIGFCYIKMGMLDRAYYYLELNRNSGEMSHCCALVNLLANTSDVRAFHYINAYMKAIEENYPDFEEAPENVRKFVSFLKRRHAFCLVNAGLLDEAKQEFEQMLDDPLSCDYAQQELDYIAQLRKSNDNAANSDADSGGVPSHEQ